MRLEGQVISGVKWSATAKLPHAGNNLGRHAGRPSAVGPGRLRLDGAVHGRISSIVGVAEFGLGAALIQAPQLTRPQIARIGGALLLFNGMLLPS